MKNFSKKDKKQLPNQHKINTPIIAKYSRAYVRHQLALQLKDRDITLQSMGFKANQQRRRVKDKKEYIKTQTPYVKPAEVKEDIQITPADSTKHAGKIALA